MNCFSLYAPHASMPSHTRKMARALSRARQSDNVLMRIEEVEVGGGAGLTPDANPRCKCFTAYKLGLCGDCLAHSSPVTWAREAIPDVPAKG